MASHREDHLTSLIIAIEQATGEARTRLLHDLGDRLDAHFRAEDAPDGWFARAIRDAPDLALRLKDLAAEHLELSSMAVSLLRNPDPEREKDFLASLSRHEQQEAEVLSEIMRRS